jgi:hypothetical protein
MLKGRLRCNHPLIAGLTKEMNLFAGPFNLRRVSHAVLSFVEGRFCSYLCESNNPRSAYAELRKGMLGTGESQYSQLLTKYFDQCLEKLCAHQEAGDYAHKFACDLNDIRPSFEKGRFQIWSANQDRQETFDQPFAFRKS